MVILGIEEAGAGSVVDLVASERDQHPAGAIHEFELRSLALEFRVVEFCLHDPPSSNAPTHGLEYRARIVRIN